MKLLKDDLHEIDSTGEVLEASSTVVEELSEAGSLIEQEKEKVIQKCR